MSQDIQDIFDANILPQDQWMKLSRNEKLELLKKDYNQMTLERILEVGFGFFNNFLAFFKGGVFRDVHELCIAQKKDARTLRNNLTEQGINWETLVPRERSDAIGGICSAVCTDIDMILQLGIDSDPNLASLLRIFLISVKDQQSPGAYVLCHEFDFLDQGANLKDVKEALRETINEESTKCAEAMIYVFKELRALGYRYEQLAA